jgi:hypothetical protein
MQAWARVKALLVLSLKPWPPQGNHGRLHCSKLLLESQLNIGHAVRGLQRLWCLYSWRRRCCCSCCRKCSDAMVSTHCTHSKRGGTCLRADRHSPSARLAQRQPRCRVCRFPHRMDAHPPRNGVRGAARPQLLYYYYSCGSPESVRSSQNLEEKYSCKTWRLTRHSAATLCRTIWLRA